MILKPILQVPTLIPKCLMLFRHKATSNGLVCLTHTKMHRDRLTNLSLEVGQVSQVFGFQNEDTVTVTTQSWDQPLHWGHVFWILISMSERATIETICGSKPSSRTPRVPAATGPGQRRSQCHRWSRYLGTPAHRFECGGKSLKNNSYRAHKEGLNLPNVEHRSYSMLFQQHLCDIPFLEHCLVNCAVDWWIRSPCRPCEQPCGNEQKEKVPEDTEAGSGRGPTVPSCCCIAWYWKSVPQGPCQQPPPGRHSPRDDQGRPSPADLEESVCTTLGLHHEDPGLSRSLRRRAWTKTPTTKYSH